MQIYPVCSEPGYQSWPMIHSIASRLVCAWSSGTEHDIFENIRFACSMISDDGGCTWKNRSVVINSPDAGDVPVGKGSDSTGAMLLWIRSSGNQIVQKLFRTENGLNYELLCIPELNPIPMQITDIFSVPGLGLMCLWFPGRYRDNHNAWGTLVSTDDGRSWKQDTIEQELPLTDWPTEPSAFYAGNRRIFCITRTERGAAQFQLQSEDDGRTWKRMITNITDVQESTPSLIFTPHTGRIDNYYYQRGAGLLKRRSTQLNEIWNRPDTWPNR